jgi:hypothetical protein
MELSLYELILRILNDTNIRSVVVKVTTTSSPATASLLLQKKGSGQYIIAISSIVLDKVDAAIRKFVSFSTGPEKDKLPKNFLKPFTLPVAGIPLQSSVLNINYDVMLAAYWNGPFGHFVFTRQISNDDKNALQRVSDVFHDQISNDELLRDVILK